MNHNPFGVPFQSGIIARLKAINPDILATHCTLHRHHYSLTSWKSVTKSMRLFKQLSHREEEWNAETQALFSSLQISFM